VSASIAIGASQTFTAIYTMTITDVINGAGLTNGVTNTATATGRDPANTLVTSGPANAATSITSVAAVNVTKTAASPTTALGANATFTDAGDTITFFYVVKNMGSVALTLARPVDVGPKFNSIAGTNTLSAFTPASVSLAIGAQQTFTATYTLSLADVANGVGLTNGVSNTATATARNPANVIVNSASSTATTTVIAVPALALVKTGVLVDNPGGGATTADLAEVITYSYVVQNVGNAPITNVTINDLHGTPAAVVPLGAGGITGEVLTVVGPYGAAASTDSSANDGTWTTLAPGASIKFNWPHAVTQAEMDHG
jgi:hypothetical protein